MMFIPAVCKYATLIERTEKPTFLVVSSPSAHCQTSSHCSGCVCTERCPLLMHLPPDIAKPHLTVLDVHVLNIVHPLCIFLQVRKPQDLHTRRKLNPIDLFAESRIQVQTDISPVNLMNQPLMLLLDLLLPICGFLVQEGNTLLDLLDSSQEGADNWWEEISDPIVISLLVKYDRADACATSEIVDLGSEPLASLVQIEAGDIGEVDLISIRVEEYLLHIVVIEVSWFALEVDGANQMASKCETGALVLMTVIASEFSAVGIDRNRGCFVCGRETCLNNDSANCLGASRLVLLDVSYNGNLDYLGFVAGFVQDHQFELFGKPVGDGDWSVVDGERG
jgi:hypothetical protein